ncbi:MAG TPA: GTP-binding protein [Acidiferrobacterales bacterium]|nr:GTP-binding protein [Acidiferrobacterales bacterium]
MPDQQITAAFQPIDGEKRCRPVNGVGDNRGLRHHGRCWPSAEGAGLFRPTRSRIVFIVRNITRESIEALFAAVGALGAGSNNNQV